MTGVGDDLAQRLLAFIDGSVSVSAEPIDADTDLLLSGAVDSLGVVRVTQWIEDETGSEIDPGDVTLENFQTVSCMVAYIEKLVASEN
jgi:acyl carrier protein